MSKLNERVIFVIIIFITLLSAVAAMLLVTTYDISINVPGFSSNSQHYSEPITILTQSAPGSDGRNAYVKMTLVAASGERSTSRKLSEQDAIVKSIIAMVLTRHSPDSMLESSGLVNIQNEIADNLSEALSLPIDQVYFDRITVQ